MSIIFHWIIFVFSLVSRGYEVHIVYDAQVRVFANIDALIHFNNTVLVPKRAA